MLFKVTKATLETPVSLLEHVVLQMQHYTFKDFELFELRVLRKLDRHADKSHMLSLAL